MNRHTEKRYGVSAVKNRLAGYREAERDIDYQIERLERLRAKVFGVGSPEITDMPRNPSPVQDRIAGLLAQCDELEREIREMTEHQLTERDWIEGTVRRIRSAEQRAVIRMRYLDGEKWMDITEELFGRKIDFEEKEENYLRTVTNLHGRALLNMAKAMEENGEQSQGDA